MWWQIVRTKWTDSFADPIEIELNTHKLDWFFFYSKSWRTLWKLLNLWIFSSKMCSLEIQRGERKWQPNFHSFVSSSLFFFSIFASIKSNCAGRHISFVFAAQPHIAQSLRSFVRSCMIVCVLLLFGEADGCSWIARRTHNVLRWYMFGERTVSGRFPIDRFFDGC